MEFINVVARWPGSVHDARILRQSHVFEEFEGDGDANPIDGLMLADSGYMLRRWLLTPFRNPETRSERAFNYAHCSTRSTIERTIGVAKQRWQCLRYMLRLHPAKACRVIMGKPN